MSPLMPKLFVSAIFGLIYGVVGYFMMIDLPDAWRWGLIFGLGAFAIFLLVMLIKDDRRARRYERAEKKLPCPPQLRVGANVRTGRGVAGIQVYLCDGEMYLVNVHGKELEVTSTRTEYFDSPDVNDVVGYLPLGRYTATAVSDAPWQGYRWATFLYGDAEYWTALLDDRVRLVDAQTGSCAAEGALAELRGRVSLAGDLLVEARELLEEEEPQN